MTQSRIRTISFYEVVRGKDDHNPRMDPVDWQDALDGMLHKPPTLRTFTSPDGDVYIGESVAYLNQMHLIVGRIAAGNMQTVDLDHGHIEELRLEGNRGFIDTSTVCFLDYANIVGVMHGNQAAPRSSAIQRWMNACGMITEDVALWPVISKSVWEKLQNASAVHNVELTFRPNPAFMPQEGVSSLALAERQG